MRSILMKTLLLCATTATIAATTAASASASQWYVGGKALTGSTKLATTTNVEEDITFSAPSLGLRITCTSVNLVSPEITAPGSLKAQEETYLGGCKATEGPKGCTVLHERGEPFAGLAGTAVLGTAPEDTLELKSPKAAAFIVFELAECGSLDGQMALTGKIPFAMPTGQTESVEQALVGKGTKSTSLEYEGNYVYVTGKFKLKLASGSKWSFH